MGLDKAGLESGLKTMFETLNVNITAETKAGIMATLIDAYVKTAIATTVIPPGTVIIAVSGGSGAPAVGVPNPAPISIVGDPDGLPPGGLT